MAAVRRAAYLLMLAALVGCRGSVEPALPVLLLAADSTNARIVLIRSAAVIPPGPGDAAGAIAGFLDLGGARPWDLAMIPERDRLLVALSDPGGTNPRIGIYDTTGLNYLAPSLTLVQTVPLPPFALAGAPPSGVDPSPRRLAVQPGGRFVAVVSEGRLDPALGEVPAVIDLLDLAAANPYLAGARLIAGRAAELPFAYRLTALVTSDLLVLAIPFHGDATMTLDGYLLAYRLGGLVAGAHVLAWRAGVAPGQLINPTDLLALDGTEAAVLATPGTGFAAARTIDTGLSEPGLGPPTPGFEGADRLLRFGGELVFARRAGAGFLGAVLLPGETATRRISGARTFTVAPNAYLHAAGSGGVITTLDLALIRAGVATGVRLDLVVAGLGEVEALATVIVHR